MAISEYKNFENTLYVYKARISHLESVIAKNLQQNFDLETKNQKLHFQAEKLRTAIKKTLDENGHLADGDNCTLIELKRAIGDE